MWAALPSSALGSNPLRNRRFLLTKENGGLEGPHFPHPQVEAFPPSRGENHDCGLGSFSIAFEMRDTTL